VVDRIDSLVEGMSKIQYDQVIEGLLSKVNKYDYN